MLKCGIFESDITPYLGMGMPGYFHERLGSGIKEKLSSEAVYFENDGDRVVLVSNDSESMATSVLSTMREEIAKALQIREAVTSPTFTLIQEYKGGAMPLYHFDIYRLDSEDELLDLGYEDYFYGDGLAIVEWADKAESLLPEDAIRISLAYGQKEDTRIATVEGLCLAGFTGKKA